MVIGISALINKGEPCEDTAGTWPFMKEDALSSTSESASALIVDFPASITVRRNVSCLCHSVCDIFLTRAKRG